ncbi:O-glucosyltransferase rumi-like, partial [Olea europaea subsp. europaea]
MKGNSEEKLMKTYWMRSAFQKNKASSKSTLIASLFFCLLPLLFLAAWINLAKYACFSSQKALQNNPSNSDLQFPLNCSIWNQTNTCPKYYPTSYKPSNPNPLLNPKCPEFFRWIHEDLRPWRETGITTEMVEKALKTAHFRLVILDGKIYVEKFRQSIQTRALFTMWGILQLMRWYPGKLPDLELMFDCDDRPVIQAKHFRRPDSGPPPLFRYCSDWKSLDIVFPDWSFWGWAETNIKPWRIVLKDMREGNKKTKWEDRVPYAYWRGNPNVCPWRADLMKCNVTDKNDWNTRLYVQDWDKEAKIGYKQSNVADQCTHRYKIYIEGWAWSVSEKYILACDSPTLLMTPRWHDFFIRGMIPQQHYWPVRDNDKCKSLKFAVDYGNNHTQKITSVVISRKHYRLQFICHYYDTTATIAPPPISVVIT